MYFLFDMSHLRHVPFWSMDRFLTYEWAVLDSCGPFWTSTRAILDQAMGRFCPSRGPFWFMGSFGIDP